MFSNVLKRKTTNFVLWRPGNTDTPPTLYIGILDSSLCNPYQNFQEIPLHVSPQFPDLWEIPASECSLNDGQVYHYWFKICNTNPYSEKSSILYCTDPIAYTIDRRVFPPKPPDNDGLESYQPASVILYQNGLLIPCDRNGETSKGKTDVSLDTLPANNRLVIYELPTRWADIESSGDSHIGNGTFEDVLALLVKDKTSPTFSEINELNNHAHLIELGINALELLPPADSPDKFEWGYGTANYFAADFDLENPETESQETARNSLLNLINICHEKGLRFFLDIVMAFSRENPYRYINFFDFYVKWGSGDPEQTNREAFGGDLFKYNYWVEGYHPIDGNHQTFVPARAYMKVSIEHWIHYYQVDGLRLDSVNNIANYDFVEELKTYARFLWEKRGGSSDRFLVAGEELSVPLSLIHQNRLESLWNEKFKHILRHVILGKNAPADSSFEWSVRKLIDCRFLGFTDGAQAINYVTSHDVEGIANERLFNYLINHNVYDTAPRIKLAFVCLLTAVGIPMILAGEEFADEHDLDIFYAEEHDRVRHKQVDPVNYSRLEDHWRRDIFEYVSRLVHFRRQSNALAVNDTEFIHADFHEGKRVVVWQRGRGDDRVVVVANFSDYGTPNPLSSDAEYVVANWPATPPGKYWKEITLDRMVLSEWVGREPIFPWEAKVYTLS